MRVFKLGRHLEMVWFLELGVRSRNNSTLPLPNPADDAHLEFYFEQTGIYRDILEKKKQMQISQSIIDEPL